MIRKGCLAVVLLMIFTLRVSAIQRGSICLNMKYGGCPVSGGSIAIYRIDNWNCGSDCTAEMLENYGQITKMPCIRNECETDGMVRFSGLDAGTYLVVQETEAPGYYRMKPFLVSIPIQIDSDIIWDVSAAPKLQPRPEQQLPQTGQLNQPVWILGSIGLALIGTGMILNRKK